MNPILDSRNSKEYFPFVLFCRSWEFFLKFLMSFTIFIKEEENCRLLLLKDCLSIFITKLNQSWDWDFFNPVEDWFMLKWPWEFYLRLIKLSIDNYFLASYSVLWSNLLVIWSQVRSLIIKSCCLFILGKLNRWVIPIENYCELVLFNRSIKLFMRHFPCWWATSFINPGYNFRSCSSSFILSRLSIYEPFQGGISFDPIFCC